MNMDATQPIDAVVMWVDGSSDDFQRAEQTALEEERAKGKTVVHSGHVTVTMVSFATLLEVLSRICRGFGTYTWLRMGRSRTISISPFRGFHKCHILISFPTMPLPRALTVL